MKTRIHMLALVALTLGASATAFAQTDDVVVDGRIITGENYDSAAKGKTVGFSAYDSSFQGGIRVAGGDVDGAPNSGGSRHTGGMLVVLGGGSVRSLNSSAGKDEVITTSGNRTEGPKLGSLKGLDSIKGLSTPQGAGQPASAQNNLKQIGVGFHNANSGGDVNGDGIADIIVGTGASGHVKAFDGTTGAGAGPHVKVFDAGRAAGPKTGGTGHVKVFDGNTGQAAATQGRGAFVLSTDRVGPAASSTGAKTK